MIIVYIVLASLAIWIVSRIQYRKRERKQYETAFTDSFKHIEPTPLLRIRNSYGFPSFEVTFRNKNLLEEAEKNGLTKDFVERIRQIHSNFKEFDADRAIYFTWAGRTYTIVTPPQ